VAVVVAVAVVVVVAVAVVVRACMLLDVKKVLQHYVLMFL